MTFYHNAVNDKDPEPFYYIMLGTQRERHSTSACINGPTRKPFAKAISIFSVQENVVSNVLELRRIQTIKGHSAVFIES